MTLPMVLFLSAACLATLFLSTLLVLRFPVIGFVLSYGILLTAWEFPSLPPLMTLGGSNIFVPDAVALVLLAAALTRVSRIRLNVGSMSIPWFGFGLLLLGSLARGIGEFGLGPAVNEARLLLVPFAVITWALSLDWTGSHAKSLLYDPLIWFGWLLVALAGYHAIRYGAGSATSAFIDVNGVEQSSRVLTQMQSFVLVLATLLCLDRWISTPSRSTGLAAIAFTATIVITQQRTVWAAFTISLLVYFLMSAARIKLKVFAIAGVLGFLATAIFVSDVAEPLLKDLTDSFSSRSTYDARTEGWEQLIVNAWAGGAETVAWGQPFGSGFERVESNGRIALYSPHNWYVLLFLRVGVFGLALYAWFLMRSLMAGFIRRQSPVALAILIGISVFCWAYGISWTFGAIFAWAVITAKRAECIPSAATAANDGLSTSAVVKTRP